MRWFTCLLPLLTIIGCGPVEPIDTDPTTTIGGDPGTTDPGPRYDDEGSIVLMLRHPEANNPNPQVALAAVFAQSTRSWRNLAGCLATKNGALDGLCFEEFPEEPGDWVVAEPWTEDLMASQLDTIDIGSPLNVAQYSVNGIDNDGEWVYFDVGLANLGVPQDGDLDIAFRQGDWGKFERTDVAPVPDPMLLQSPSPTRRQALAPGKFRLVWTPGLVGQVYLSVASPNVNRIYRLEDNGVYDLDVDALGLEDGDSVILTLGRWTDTIVDHRGARIEVLIQDEQVIRAVYRDLQDRNEIFPANTCGEAAVMPEIVSGRYFGRLQSMTDELQPSGCIGGGTGPEGILRASLNDGGEISVNFGIYATNAVGYLMTSCGDFGTCLEGSNTPGIGAPEALGWVNNTGGTTDVYIVMDSVQGPIDDLFVLDVDILQVYGNVLNDSCADAIYQTPISNFPPGTARYVGNIVTYHNYSNPLGTYYCDPGGYIDAKGQEGVAKIVLQPGETITADVEMPGADPVLYLTYNCAIVQSCPPYGIMDTPNQETERISFTNQNPVEEEMYLMVDSKGESGAYTLDVRIE